MPSREWGPPCFSPSTTVGFPEHMTAPAEPPHSPAMTT